MIGCTRLLAALGSTVAVVAVSGCTVTASNLPMPEPGIGGPGYTIHAAFRDALNLPERAHVKIGGTDIGVVTEISSADFVADITMEIRHDIVLPRGTTAELRQATPLGDVFVAMTLPSKANAGEPLRAGDTIGTDHTATAASVEQLMMSMSLLLNGGGLEQAGRITSDLDSMLSGRAPQFQDLLKELTEAITALNQRTGDIDRTLGGMSALTGELAAHKAELASAADNFPQLIGLLAENNQGIADLLRKIAVTMTALGDFTDTTGPQFVGLFDSIQKLMAGFAGMGDDLTGTLQGLDAVYPGAMASLRGPSLAVAATVSYLDVGSLTDPKGSRPPDLGDLGAFQGSLAQVIAKVLGRLGSPPRQPDSPDGTPQQSGGNR
ncbi:MCE family protein [Nocardia stercoris]|uniref:MCE family protein n=1 Tax=Nocardia stercoris TaxID=2483361 RepID=A0A3M2L0S2_9NOCA|nr:MCE family protein [Nocardia stercoris]RMI30320.1 MCE family protein [Nocardia stercoris]